MCEEIVQCDPQDMSTSTYLTEVTSADQLIFRDHRSLRFMLSHCSLGIWTDFSLRTKHCACIRFPLRLTMLSMRQILKRYLILCWQSVSRRRNYRRCNAWVSNPRPASFYYVACSYVSKLCIFYSNLDRRVYDLLFLYVRPATNPQQPVRPFAIEIWRLILWWHPNVKHYFQRRPLNVHYPELDES